MSSFKYLVRTYLFHSVCIERAYFITDDATKKEICVCKSNFLDHTLILFKNLCTLRLFDLIKLGTAMSMYEVYYNLLLLNLLEHFLHIPSCHSTRKSRKIYVTYSRTTKNNTALHT